jgi:hypothetical protein
MRNAITIIITATVLTSIALSGCENKNHTQKISQQAEAKPAEKLNQTHTQLGVQPGSHEDWCGEHQLPESMCTRCNPSLIPAFKATGDWCEEHGLPESQCHNCNPKLKIERPPKTDGATP